MSDGTKIEWTDATWNVVNGCSVLSPGCTNCYAMRLAGTRLRDHPSRAGLTRETKAGPVWTGEVRFSESALLQPLRWKRPRRIFVCAHGDLFHDAVPDAWIDRVFAVMALCPQHQFQVLTKRSARMRAYMQGSPWNGWTQSPATIARAIGELAADARSKFMAIGRCHEGPLPNVWLGVSVEDQKRGDERIPDLLATPAAVRWLSCEPLLGPVQLFSVAFDGITELNVLAGEHIFSDLPQGRHIDWVVAGGESGPGARGSTAEVEQWMRSLRDECQASGVPFFGKQNFKKLPLPEDLLIREMPNAR